MKDGHIRRQSRKILVLLLAATLIFTITACGGAKMDEDHSPVLKDVKIMSYSENTESSQYVLVDLVFDRDISITEDKCSSLHITIADERVQDDEYILMEGENSKTARIKISVNAVTKGVLKIDKLKEDKHIKEICSADGKYAACDFSVEAIIPSGVTLSTVESGNGRVVKSVDSYWNIRSIAWVGLIEDGALVPVSETRQLEMLDGYAAVHGHEFLMEDEDDIAESIAETLENNYGSEYEFSYDDNRITAVKSGSDAVIDIEIYQYKKINDQLIR